MTDLAKAERALDTSALAAASAAAEALDRFDALEPGERFILSGTDDGAEVLRRLQAERIGLFEWSPLEAGPSVWRTEIARRDRPAGAARQVLEALAWDHDRLDALEQAAFRARESGDLPAAIDLFEEFAVGLRRHIGFEEALLFPAFEDATGTPPTAGPTAVMRAEHREIEELLDRIAAGIGDSATSLEPLRAAFHSVLGDHNFKEEQVLYPGTDQLLGPMRADRLVRAIQSYGPGRSVA
jgi:uncharacterized protein (DUF2249 family)/hemerythrin-like domain-containing protein